MKGFHGCYWRFDLARGEGERIPIDDSMLQRTLGGVGLGAWLLPREAPVGVDPLAPEAPLIFSFSPLVGTSFITSAKFAVVAKSPLTGGISDALSSSHFAIAIRGEIETPIADPERVRFLRERLRKRAAGESNAKYRELGTIANLSSFDRLGNLRTRNFQQSHFDRAEALSSERWHATRHHRRVSRASCTIGCEHRFAFDSSETRVEYESLFALGPLCGIGDPDALLDWLDDIALRRGFGDRMAEGARRLANSIGKSSIDFAPQVKGLELPGYEPRSLQTLALGFAVGTRGADHNRSGAYEADFSGEIDRICGGVDSGKRVVHLRKACNIREGVHG